MATSHLCGKTWEDGTVASCPKHQKLDGKRRSVWGKGIRRKMDREAGEIGQDRGGYING
jgi:hypothetical protein